MEGDDILYIGLVVDKIGGGAWRLIHLLLLLLFQLLPRLCHHTSALLLLAKDRGKLERPHAHSRIELAQLIRYAWHWEGILGMEGIAQVRP